MYLALRSLRFFVFFSFFLMIFLRLVRDLTAGGQSSTGSSNRWLPLHSRLIMSVVPLCIHLQYKLHQRKGEKEGEIKTLQPGRGLNMAKKRDCIPWLPYSLLSNQPCCPHLILCEECSPFFPHWPPPLPISPSPFYTLTCACMLLVLHNAFPGPVP